MKVCVWMKANGEYTVPHDQLVLNRGEVITGDIQSEEDDTWNAAIVADMEETTIVKLRTECGLADELNGFANDRKAWVYTDHRVAGSLTMVLIQWPD